MKILFIGPIPPPISGHSIAVKALYDFLVKSHTLILVNTSKKSLVNGNFALTRMKEIIINFNSIWRNRNRCDIVYLTISESIAGNLKDLIIYTLLHRKLNRIVIHLHGGSFKRDVLNRNYFLRVINEYFLSKAKNIIVLGKSHVSIFASFVDNKKILIVPNFAYDNIFVDEIFTIKKFNNNQILRLYYFSNLITGKGYDLLLEAYKQLDESVKNKVTLDFAGSFESEEAKDLFKNSILDDHRIKYLGTLDGLDKEIFLKSGHIFCLPTSLFEGQPISIIEAYASGSIVLTTAKPGILDIFTDGINGFIIDDKSAKSIKNQIELIVNFKIDLKSMALKNVRFAKDNFTLAKYCQSLQDILCN